MSNLADKILNVLKGQSNGMLTIDIAKSVGLQTRSQVNPTIYGLEKAGKVVKLQDQPPIWRLAELTPPVNNKSKVLYLTEGGFIGLSDVIPLLQEGRISDIIYFTTDPDSVVETDGVNYQLYGVNDDYSYPFFCNVMLLTADPNIEIYVSYDHSNDMLKQLFSLPLLSKSSIKVISSLHELV